MAEKINIASLDIDTEALITKATETKKSIDSLRDSQKNLKKIGEQNSKQFVKNEVELKKLSAEYNQQKNVLTKLTDENNRFIKSEQALTNAVNKEIKSIEVARKNNKELLAIRNKLNLSTEEGKKQLDLINKKLDENNQFIKENVSAYEQQKIGIGDYEGAIRRVFPAGGQLIDVLKQLKAGLVSQKTALQGATIGTTGLTKASKLLRIALISTGIGAIVVALGTLITAFNSTQKGADAVSKALAPIKGAFEGIIGVIQNISLNIFSQLGDRFTIVSGCILNGIDKIRLGWNKLSGDTEEAEMLQKRIKERTEEIGDATKSLEKKTSDFVKILSDAPNKIKESSDAQVKVVDLQKKIEEAEADLNKTRKATNSNQKPATKGRKNTTKIDLGFSGVSIGSPFIACEEADISTEYKQACVDYGKEDIVISTKISGSPCTVINTPYVQKIGTQQNWLERILSNNKKLKLGFSSFNPWLYKLKDFFLFLFLK